MRKGKDCWIVGSGFSLNNFDFSKLDDKFTIGVNHVIEHYDNLDCLIFADRIFTKTTTYDLSKFNGLIFASEKTIYCDQMQEILNQDNVFIYQDNRTAISWNLENQGLYHPTNSGMMAMNLALIMEAKPIYLLGYDYKYLAGNMHFYENKEHHNRYPEQKFIKKLDKMVRFSEYRDRFINCSMNSNLNLFTKKPLEDVL